MVVLIGAGAAWLLAVGYFILLCSRDARALESEMLYMEDSTLTMEE